MLFFQLLLGIKDTDDSLVASTLICLSELVPILGADTVIGGNRSKYFTDGRPNSKTNALPIPTSPILTHERRVYLPEKSLNVLPCSENIYVNGNNDLEAFDNTLSLNERPSPVGGESIEDEYNITEESKKIANNFESEDDWSDWDNTNRQLTFEPSPTDEDITDTPLIEKDLDVVPNFIPTILNENDSRVSRTILLQKAAIKAKKNILDISELDIKNQKVDSIKKEADEFDFFADMTPVIEKPNISQVNPVSENQFVSSKLNFIPDEGLDESEGWGENWTD